MNYPSKVLSAVLLGATALSAGAAEAPVKQTQTAIAAQPLGDALEEWAVRNGKQLMFDADLAAGKHTRGVSADVSGMDALSKLLEGTGLVYRVLNDRTISIFPQQERITMLSQQGANLQQVDSARPQETREPLSAQSTARESRDSSEIIVTGSHIRGVQPSSPILTITAQEMRLSGHADLGEAIRALPQNYSGGQNPGIPYGIVFGDNRNGNRTGGSSLNLRGLGPNATLTLLNGTRMPYDGDLQATDVASIPIAAIDRMEILLDGASAIYGSDAIGGVANIVLKRDYNGVELSARYGAATEGGYQQTQYTGVAGHQWASGGFILTGEIADNGEVKARQRSYLAAMPYQDNHIFPGQERKSALLSGHQLLGAAQVAVDAFYSERSSHMFVQNVAASYSHPYFDSSVWGVSPSVQFKLPAQWSLRVHGVTGHNETHSGTTAFLTATGALAAQNLNCACNRTDEAGVETEGPLFAMSGGAARLSVGGGYRRNEYERLNLLTGVASVTASSRSRFAYSEVNLPLAPRFALNGALRYENYDDYGTSTTPKIGATWTPVTGLDLKASWGKSFKAPTLNEQYSDPVATLTTISGTRVLLSQGGNPDLYPERAEIFTAGVTWQPQALPGFAAELGWFDIKYTDRITAPLSPIGQALSNPVFAPFVARNPTVAQLNAVINAAPRLDNFTGAPYDPATVVAILYNQPTNVAVEKATGFDLELRYRMDLLGGSFNVKGGASWMESDRQITSLSAPLQMAGFTYFPPELKGRLAANWSRGGFTLASTVNYIGGVKNSNFLDAPKGSAMTTLDLVADYQLDSGLLAGTGINLAVTNVLNRDPPWMQTISNVVVPFDPTNYSALGRVVSATVTKRF